MAKKLLSFPIAVICYFLLGAGISYGQCPSSVGVSSDIGKTICEGTAVTFSASLKDNTKYEYEWTINGTPVAGEANFSYGPVTDLINNDVIRVRIVSTDGVACTNVISSPLTMTVNSKRTPTVTLSNTNASICPGGSITFTASNTNGGTSPQYTWILNGTEDTSKSGSSITYNGSDLNGGNNTVRVVLTSSLNCLTVSTAEATSSVTVNPDATISNPGNKVQNICINTAIDQISFTIGGGGTGANVVGLPPGISGSYNNGTFTLNGTPSTAGTFNYTVTTTGTCAQTSVSGTITVAPDATISLASGNNNQTVCQGDAIAPITYDIGQTGNGAELSGLPVGFQGVYSNGTFTITGSGNSVGTFNYKVNATGDCGKSGQLSGSITINENLVPSVSIVSDDTDNTICAETAVTFTATPTNGGSTPSYQWKINGSNAGTNSDTFITSNLTDGQSVTVVLTSSETCVTTSTATSNAIITSVNPNLTPEVTIASTDTDICAGNEVTFTATPTNGGTFPSYQWKINGNNVGTGSDTFTTSNLADGQSVTVILTSSETCLSTPTATSNAIITQVNPNLTPEVTIASNDSDNLICSGSSVTFTASPLNGGSSPTYQWQINSSNVGGPTGATISTTNLNDNDVVSVIMTSNEECLATSTATSNKITIDVDSSISDVIPVITGPSALCPVVSGLTYSVEPIAGATSYQWSFPSGWNITSGGSTNSVTVTATANAATGIITVVGQNECGSTGTPSPSFDVSTGTVVYVSAGPDQIVCAGTTSVKLAGEVGGVIKNHNEWDWIPSVPGGTFSSDQKLDATYTLPSSIVNGGTVSIKIRSIDPAGPCDLKEDEMTITVLSDATLSNPTNKDQTACINTDIDPITYNIGTSGAGDTAGTGATVLGLPDGLSGSYTSGSFTITGTPTEAGTFDYTVNTTGDCSQQQTAQTGTITVQPDPTINNPVNKDQTICINTGITPISFSITAPGTGATVEGLPNGIAGSFSNGTFVLTGIPTVAGSFTYKVTTTGDCVSAFQNGIITVDPDPTISDPANKNQTVCINSTIEPINFKITEPGIGATFSGLPAGITGNFDGSTFTLSGTPTESGSFDYTVTTTGDCVSASQNGILSVTPLPTATISYASTPFCLSDTSAQPVELSGTNAYTGGTFSAPQGIALNTSNGTITPASSEPGTYTITYTSPASGGCEGISATTQVVITRTPSAEISYASPFCTSNNTAQEVTYSNTVGNYQDGTFIASPSGLSINSNTGAIDPSKSNPGNYMITYTIPASNGCESLDISTQVVITQQPEVNISYNSPFCSVDDSDHTVTFSDTAGTYENGTFSATAGLDIDQFGTINPAGSSSGTHTVTYSIPSGEGCGNVEATAEIVIFNDPVITTQPTNVGICSTQPAELAVVASGDNLKYQWYKDGEALAGATSSILSFSNATSINAGDYYVIVSGEAPCSSKTSETVSLTVDENIIIIKPAENLSFCDQDFNEITFEYIAHAKGTELDFTWIKDGADLNVDQNKYETTRSGPSGVNGEYTGTLTINNVNPSDNGRYAVRIKGPDYFTCPDATTKTFTLSVTPLPTAPKIQDITYCQGETASPLTAEGEQLKWYSFDAATGYTYLGDYVTPSTSEPGAFSYWVTQSDICESPFSELVVTVKRTPSAPTTSETVNYCYDEEVTEPLSATGETGTNINWYTAADSDTPLAQAPVPATNKVGITNYWVAQSVDGCESERVKITVNVNPLPQINATSDDTVICEGSSTTLHASGAGSYVWMANGLEEGTISDLSVSPTKTTTYFLTGTNSFNCSTTTEITIAVDPATQGGIISGPESVCIEGNSGTLTLSNKIGEIQRWESSIDGVNWVTIENETSQTLDFSNLTSTTSYRAIVKSGVCEEKPSEVAVVTVDELPEGGELAWLNVGRIFTICEAEDAGYAVNLDLSGIIGDVLRWEYRPSSATTWSTVSTNGDPFTGSTLSASQVESLVNNKSTVFRVAVTNGACNQPVYSETAILSVISSEILPDPVTVNPDVICFGDEVTLSAETGYTSGNTITDDGMFDNAGITNHNWRVTWEDEVVGFDTDANNTRPDRWKRATDHPFTTAALTYPYSTNNIMWGTGVTDGNKGFAVVSSDYTSTMETPVFTIDAIDEALLTFDQAYNLTPGAFIAVEISTDGGNTYNTTLFYRGVPEDANEGITSGNYSDFGLGTIEDRPENKIQIDLGAYLGMSNLRLRFNYTGQRIGDVWAVDNINFADGPPGSSQEWIDYTDPDNPVLIGIGTSENWVPTQIGWNNFEFKTQLIFNSNGNACPVAVHSEIVKAFAFDQYTSTVTATKGECGSNSIILSAAVTGVNQGEITTYPTVDGYTGHWEMTGPADYTYSPEHITNDDTAIDAINDPNAVFTPDVYGSYTFNWILTPQIKNDAGVLIENLGCPPVSNEAILNMEECFSLDFDGINDFALIEDSYIKAKSIEVWVRPESENGPGAGKVATIYSTENYELFLNANLQPVLKYFGKTLTSNKSLSADDRWYHLAVVFDNSGAIIYIDGLEIKDKTAGTDSSTGSGGRFLIGARFNGTDVPPDNHFSGWIEELRIWNTLLTPNQIRFMMNQRLINNGARMGEQIPMDVPEGLTYNNLVGYYRLISSNPDPANLVTFDSFLMPVNGFTPDLANNSIPASLHNMTTDQQNTAPLPYISAIDGQTWPTDNTWIRPNVWDSPNSTGVTGDPIDWNIAITRHNIDSGNKDITLLGLKSEVTDKLIKMANPSSSIDETNSGQMMRITHYLLLNGNMDLVGESQLLQDEGSILAEESSGWLERDQQGKRLSFNYNYWSSMVSAQGASNNADYSLNQVLMDGTNSQNPKTINFDDRYWIADGARSNPITISNYWIWKFLGTADIYEEWYHIGSTGTLAIGEGYTMKGTDGGAGINDLQNYVFKGKPHNGDFTRSVSPQQNYLIGNPYPSALDAREFILDNLHDVISDGETGRNSVNIFNGALYFWDHFSGSTHYLERYIGGYATWNLSGSTEAISNDERIDANDAHGNKKPGQFIPVAQGFFVNTVLDPVIAQISGIEVTGGPIQFKNSQRVYEREAGNSESVFHSQEKKESKNTISTKASVDERQKIWLKFDSPLGYHRQILVTADPNTTSGFDLGYDAPLIEDNDEDMYWYFNDYEFVIQAVEDFNVDRELDLGMKVHEKGIITISINELKNIPDDMEIFLKDSLLQVTHDLRKVQYTATSDTGTFHNRFKIIFKDPNAVIDTEDEVILEEEGGEFEILYVNGNRKILVRNPQLINIDKIYLNNILGQQIHVYYNIPAEKELSLPVHRFSSGVYIVKVHSEKGTKTKKVILK